MEGSWVVVVHIVFRHPTAVLERSFRDDAKGHESAWSVVLHCLGSTLAWSPQSKLASVALRNDEARPTSVDTSTSTTRDTTWQRRPCAGW